MATTRTVTLRVWPGVLAVAIQWTLRFVVPVFWPGALEISVLGGIAGGLLVLLWWAFLSRAPVWERLGGIALMAAALAGTSRIADPSIAQGAMGMLLPILAVPTMSMAFVIWAAATRNLAKQTRWVTMVAAVAVGCGMWAMIRTGGFNGDFKQDLSWRWKKTPEEKLLEVKETPAPVEEKPAAAPVPASVAAVKTAKLPEHAPELVDKIVNNGASWPGFRGPLRDGSVPGARIETDWTASPPVEVWRRAVGPGWSSFAVGGGLVYTQEQRGPDEVVACYNLATGQPVWKHSDVARFWESNAGAGPRGTPTLSDRRVYTFGATGIVNALDARTGAVVWRRSAAADTETKIPEWGFASSPLVIDKLVVVASAGALVAYDAATGKPRWSGPASKAVSYSSPQLFTAGGVRQVLLLSETGITSVGLDDGKKLWDYAWKGYPIVQPNLTADGDILMSVSDSSGTRRIGVAQGAAGWTAEERWTSPGLKPYFNDFVVHGGYAFGFDGSILSAIDLKDGKRKWKGGRYGHGQLILLPDEDLLLVLSEEGEVALVAAAHDQFTELAKMQALDGKTWNHPALAGDMLLVRNGAEMAAYRLKMK